MNFLNYTKTNFNTIYLQLNKLGVVSSGLVDLVCPMVNLSSINTLAQVRSSPSSAIEAWEMSVRGRKCV